MTKVMFRQYEHGETIALFPNVAGDPLGDTCVAYATAGGFYAVKPEVVIAGTQPAEPKQYARIERTLMQDPDPMTLTILDELPTNHEAKRKADPEAHTKFNRLARMHAHR